MAAYTVLRLNQTDRPTILPGSFVYIRKVNPPQGDEFRVAVGAGGSCGSISRLAGGGWVPVRGGLSVDPANQYAGFWLSAADASNFATSVLQSMLDGHVRTYQLAVTPEDVQRQQIRVPTYTAIEVLAIPVEGPRYFAPGFAQSAQIAGGAPEETNFWLRTRWTCSEASGYIVQRIETTLDARTCAGAALSMPGNRYWEAWQVTGANQFNPNESDYWTILLGVGTQGTWSKTGTVYWVPRLEAAWGFSPGAVTGAVNLQSTAVPPRNLGTSLITRRIGGIWNGCGGNAALNTHRHNP